MTLLDAVFILTLVPFLFQLSLYLNELGNNIESPPQSTRKDIPRKTQRSTIQHNRSHEEFSYEELDENGPSHWGAISATCDGKLQSPINLLLHNVSGIDAPRLRIKGFTKKPDRVTMTNNGHSIVIRWLTSKGLRMSASFSGGVLKATYIVHSAHFHWGTNDSSGSEHLINNRRYSLELHIVCYNSIYGKGASTYYVTLTPSAFTPRALDNVDAL